MGIPPDQLQPFPAIRIQHLNIKAKRENPAQHSSPREGRCELTLKRPRPEAERNLHEVFFLACQWYCPENRLGAPISSPTPLHCHPRVSLSSTISTVILNPLQRGEASAVAFAGWVELRSILHFTACENLSS